MALTPRDYNKRAELAAQERNSKYPLLRLAGLSDADIARRWGVSRERVRQISQRFKQQTETAA